MLQRLDNPHTVEELLAESDRIRERAAAIMAEMKSILGELAERKAGERGISADE